MFWVGIDPVGVGLGRSEGGGIIVKLEYGVTEGKRCLGRIVHSL